MRHVENHGTVRHAKDGTVNTRMRVVYWMTKATKTHSEYVTLIVLPRREWLRERASLLRHSKVPLLLFKKFFFGKDFAVSRLDH